MDNLNLSANGEISTTPLTISVCIATHERAALLQPTLEALARQKRLPDEIVISDSSLSDQTERVVESFRCEYPDLNPNYVKTSCKALPWHRWNGFQHSKGEIVVFIDDDIRLEENALKMLEETYLALFSDYGYREIAGVGFYIFLDDGLGRVRRPKSFEERWLGIGNAPSASITAGGIGVPPKSMPKDTFVEVERLSGGGMSFRRDVLIKVGFLDQLVDLFGKRIGPSEDSVLSYYARLSGKLFMLTYQLAIHPNEERSVHTVDRRNGWKKGVMETWGRAHTMRWMSRNLRSYRLDWLRVATLEILRSVWWGILRQPFTLSSWARFAGAFYGFFISLICWGRIPPSARTEV